MKRLCFFASCLVSGVLAAPCYAMDVTWSGFASIVAGETIGGDDSYNADPDFEAPGVYTNDLDFRPESLMALQAKIQVAEDFTATAQVLSKANNNNNAEFEWAYVSYHITSETTLNAGRYRLPFYYYSDFLDAAYAYHFIRPPRNVYWVGHSSLDGINLYDSRYFGDIGVTTQIWYGNDVVKERYNNMVIKKDMGMNIALEYEWFTVRYMYNRKGVYWDYYDQDVKPFDKPGDFEFVSLTDYTYNAFAFMADVGNFLWRSEFTRQKQTLSAVIHNVDVGEGGVSNIIDIPINPKGEQDYWYVSAGYYIGSILPHYTRSLLESLTDDSKVTTDTYGFRWNVKPGVAFKLEYSIAKTTGGAEDDTVKLVATAIDIVF